MFSTEAPPPPAKLPLDEDGSSAIQRLGRWMRVVGTIQLALSGMALLVLSLSLFCGLSALLSSGMAALLTLLPVAGAAAFLLQALRTQEAGEQIKSLAEEHDVDYLELTFIRLKTVFVIDLVLGSLIAIRDLLALVS